MGNGYEGVGEWEEGEMRSKDRVRKEGEMRLRKGRKEVVWEKDDYLHQYLMLVTPGAVQSPSLICILPCKDLGKRR